jgi:periplasmic protein TonB
MRRVGKLAAAIVVSLIVNTLSLLVLNLANRSIDIPEKEREPNPKTIAINEPPPKKRHRPITRTMSSRRSARPRRSAVPNLPSRVSVPGLALSDRLEGDFMGDLVGELDALSSDLIFTEEAVDTPPRVIARVAPKYPWSAEKRGDEGYVIFKIRLSSEGVIEKLWTEASRPSGIFDAAAEKAVRQYRFSPATYKGKPVPVICRQKVVFQLGS